MNDLENGEDKKRFLNLKKNGLNALLKYEKKALQTSQF